MDRANVPRDPEPTLDPTPQHPASQSDADDLAAHALRLLARGAADRRAAFHAPTLSTVGLDGRPRARTVVLRGLDVAERLIRLHSDLRSAKVAELRRDPRVALVFYDAAAKLQVRAEGMAAVHAGDDVAREAWSRSQPMARAIYAAADPPGTPIAAPAPADAPADGAEANFAVIRCVFDRLDLLSLQAAGHRRLVLRWDGGERTAQWLTP
jgi:pyridoxine/pyridoxamine 5'-phosphate oxidase